MDEVPMPPHGTVKAINIRSMKVFLMVVAGKGSLTSNEIENLIDYLDKDSDGFINFAEFAKELQFLG